MKIGLAALATLAFTTTSAFANTAENPFAQDQAVLTLKGLDLATADGQERLAIRVDQAARAVCGERLSGVHLAAEAKTQACRTAVVADVRAQIEGAFGEPCGAHPACQHSLIDILRGPAPRAADLLFSDL